MKKLKKTMSIFLTVAMVFTDAGITTLAAETVNAGLATEETEQEILTEDVSTGENFLEESPQEEDFSEEDFQDDNFTEMTEASKDTQTDSEEIKETSTDAEEIPTKETVGGEETNTETTQVLTDNADTGDTIGGTYEGITWSIDGNGKLLLEGTGEKFPNDVISEYCSGIKSAEVRVQGMKDASRMFEDCISLTSVDLSNFDTSNVTDMSRMFSTCENLTSVDLSSFNTGNVEDMSHMFYRCSRLESLDLSGFDTRNVTDMSYMFYDCRDLSRLNLNGFDTKNVTYMNHMFWCCEGLESLDLSGFDTGSVTDMTRMFFSCSNLSSLNLSSFNTRNVRGMSEMFSYCSSLNSLDLSGFDTGNVTDMDNMFNFCEKLSSLDLSSFDTRNVTNMSFMFETCRGLSSLDLSGFDTRNVKDMNHMFASCANLENVDLGRFNTKNVINMGSMFALCDSLSSLNLSGFNTENVEDMSSMFEGCGNLHSLDLSSFDTRNVNDMHYMFLSCEGLSSLDLSGFDTRYVENMNGMLESCNSLTVIYTPCNVSASVKLPIGTWYDASGTVYTELPKNLSKSVLLAKDKKPVAYITANKVKTVYYNGDTINTDDLEVVYYAPDGTKKQLKDSEYTTNAASINTSDLGEKILTITYNGLTANVKLTIIEKDEESSSVEESSETESSSVEESSEIESSSVEESSETESSSVEESSEIESSSVEESSEIESSTDRDDSSYDENERIDLASVNGTVSAVKTKVYDGSAYEPVVKVTVTEGRRKITLTEGTDYRILYRNNVNSGTGTVIVRGNGIYKGEIDKNFTINPKPIKKLKIVTGSITGTISEGSLSTLPVCVYDGTKLLQIDKDYTLSNYKRLKATSAQITVTGKGNYGGAAAAKFVVYENAAGVSIIGPENVKLSAETMAYTGKALKPGVKVTVNGTELTTKNYKVQYQNNKNAGTGFVVVTGKGVYKGKAVIPFTITTVSVPSSAITVKPIPAKTYNGKLQKPSVTVTVQSGGKAKRLAKNRDYSVSYVNNLHAGTATVIVTGKGNYAGLTKNAEFIINPQKIKKASVKGTQGNLILTYGKRVLKEGTDYEKPIYGETKKNKVRVTITGKGDFDGEITKNVKVQ